MWGDTTIQEHYLAGREVREVLKSQIEAVCQCGFLTMKPTNDFEQHNGGLTVRRSSVRIINSDGTTVKRLRGVNTYCSCNACANNWK